MKDKYQPQMKQPNKPQPSLMKKARKAGKLLESGMALKKVAKKVKCEVQTLKGWLSYFNWQLPAPPAPASPPAPLPSKAAIQRQAQQQKLQAFAEQCSQVKKMLEAGSSQPAVREALNLTYNSFYKSLKQLGILSDAVVKNNNKEMARQFYELADMQPDEIDQELKMQPGTVKKWVSAEKWTNDQPTMADLKWQAQKLFENKGQQQKAIAKQLSISERTISQWQKKEKWRKPVTNVQRQARQLYQCGIPQTEISKQVGVSKETVCKWKKLYKWHRPGQTLPTHKSF